MREFIYKNEESQRLDVFLSENINDTSRAQLQKMIVNGEVLVNGEEKKSNYRLSLNDVVKVEEIVEEDLEVRPIDFEIEVLYEDDYLAVVNKPAGMVVYPGAGREEVSLVAALKGMKMKLSNPEDEMRNGIVHRLDKDTSGLMMIAKDNKTHDKLSKLLKKREVVRKYYTIVNGVVEHDFGTIDAPIGRDERNRIRRTVSGAGKDAITYFKVIERFKDFTFLECELTTGRTHQIRVHMKYIDHPILGDNLYGLKDVYNLDSQLLQSYLIEFIHPYTNKQMSFSLDVRDDFKKLMKEVKS